MLDIGMKENENLQKATQPQAEERTLSKKNGPAV
jgi:hypothetical protein